MFETKFNVGTYIPGGNFAEQETKSIDSSILTSKVDQARTKTLMHGPIPSQINQFINFFKATVDLGDTVLIFYQQLQAQCPGYWILCIGIKNTRQDVDLCPVEKIMVALRNMKISIYQKLQDSDCVSEN